MKLCFFLIEYRGPLGCPSQQERHRIVCVERSPSFLHFLSQLLSDVPYHALIFYGMSGRRIFYHTGNPTGILPFVA